MGILINSFNSFPLTETETDPLNISGLQGYYKPDTIGGTTEGDALTSWTDSSGNSNDLTGSATLHFDSVSGERQMEFNGTSHRLWVADGSVYNYVPKTDEFAVVIKLGEDIIDDTDYFYQKGDGGQCQYGAWSRTDSTWLRSEVGDVVTNYTGTDLRSGNDLYILNVRTTGYDVWWNGTKIIDNDTTLGTWSTTNAWFCLGGRRNNDDSFPGYAICQIERVAIYNRVLTAQEISDIEDYYYDPILVSNLVSYWNPNTIDAGATSEGDYISTWSDNINNNDGTNTLTDRPKLHFDSVTGIKQVRFDGTNSWLDVGSPANLDFVGGTDEWSIVVKYGEDPVSTGVIIGKRGDTSKQWGLYTEPTNRLYTWVGNTDNWKTITPLKGTLIVYTVSTTGVSAWVDGVQQWDNASYIGSVKDTVGVNIGAAYDNGGLPLDGDIEFIAVYNKVLSSTERSQIENRYNEN